MYYIILDYQILSSPISSLVSKVSTAAVTILSLN